MPVFLILATLLTLAVAAVMARPLLAHSKGAAIGMGVGVVALTGALYLALGTPRGLDPGQQQAPTTI